MTNVAIINYFTYGHTFDHRRVCQSRRRVRAGRDRHGVPGRRDPVRGDPDQDARTTQDVATPEMLHEVDAILFGFPTRFGSFPAQVKAFFDPCGGLWASGALVGKPAGIFFSTGTIAAGQETTAFTAVTVLAHQGMLYVPLGFRAPEMFNMDEVHDGSPWGADAIAGKALARCRRWRRPSPPRRA